MKALVKAKRTRGIWLTDVPEPAVGPNDVLIRITKTSVCGTDIHIYNWNEWAQNTIPVPMTIGHEFAGEVVELGSEIRMAGFGVGDRVSGEGHVTCGFCRNCRAGRRHLCRNTEGIGVDRPGAFAEYIAVPAANVVKLPDAVSDDIASMLDPFGNAVHTALSYDLVGEDVLVTGAGPIGIMAAAVARFVGARNVVLTDINDYRLNLARRMGAATTVNIAQASLAETMAEIGIVEGFDVGLEVSGAPAAFKSMLETMNHGGKIALLGLLLNGTGVDWDSVIFKGLEIRGIYGRQMFETWYKAMAMIQSGLNIDAVLTHRFAIEEFQDAFDIATSGKSGKVVLDWASRFSAGRLG